MDSGRPSVWGLVMTMIMLILMMPNDDYAHRQRDQVEENARGKHPPSLHTCYEIINYHDHPKIVNDNCYDHHRIDNDDYNCDC